MVAAQNKYLLYTVHVHMWCNQTKWVCSCAFDISVFYIIVSGIFNVTFSWNPMEIA